LVDTYRFAVVAKLKKKTDSVKLKKRKAASLDAYGFSFQ